MQKSTINLKGEDMKIQGDVFCIRVSEIPKGAKKKIRTERGIILAEGEATGHAHCIIDDIEAYEAEGILYLKTDHPVEVKHEEHKPITLEEGIWKVGIIKEYDPFLEESRNVRD